MAKKKKRSDSNWILIYIMCPILVTLSAAAIICTFKEPPKISVLKDSFDRQEEQFQNKFESQAEELKKIKRTIAKLAEATGNLNFEMVEKLMSQVNVLNNKVKDYNGMEKRYIAKMEEYAEKVATKGREAETASYYAETTAKNVKRSEFEILKMEIEHLKNETEHLKYETEELARMYDSIAK